MPPNGAHGVTRPTRQLNSWLHYPIVARGIFLTSSALVFLLATFAHAQNSQFFFDPNGNLLVQKAEISAPPQILGQPQNRVVMPGESASFFVVAADTRALTYQWRFNGIPLGGSATNDALLLQNVGTNNEGQYSVVLTNPSGSVTSAPALLMIDSDTDGVPDSWELTYFGSFTNTATADLDGDGVANLTEFLDGTNPTNSASARFRLTVYTDGGGVVELAPTQLNYTNGETVTLTATPFAANVFHAWIDATNTRSNPITLTMNANKTVRAHFFPIDFVWTNLAGGDWNVASNWNPNLVPIAIDNAIITSSATVTLNSDSECLGLVLGLSSAAPTLTGSGTLTIHGAGTWINGTMSGNGRTVIETSGSLTVANPSGLGALLNTRTLENGGNVLWTGTGSIALNSGAVITNRARSAVPCPKRLLTPGKRRRRSV